MRFVASPGAVVLPIGTREIGYQISENVGDVRVEISDLCPGTNQTTSKTCVDTVIRWGRPVPTRWTTVVSCRDGRPFPRGSHVLKAIVSGEVAKTIPFTVK